MENATQHPINLTDVRHRIKCKQDVYKHDYDKRMHVSNKPLNPGDWVIIKKPFKVTKGQSKFSTPVRVVKVSCMAALLHDGGWWNKNALIKITD